MRTTMKCPKRRRQGKMSSGLLLGALGLMSFSLGACDDLGRLLAEEAKGSGHHGGSTGAGGATPVPDGGASACDPTPGYDGGGPVCVTVALDRDVACEDIPAVKDKAGADCQRRGLTLTSFGPASCSAGQFIRGLTYSCCPNAPPPPPPPPPPVSDAGAPTCVNGAFDHDVACEDLTNAKDQAWADCTKRGLELTSFGPASCLAGELIHGLKYSCCPRTETPPPPPASDAGAPVCVTEALDRDVACEDLAAVKDKAGADCQRRGLELTAFGPASCLAGEFIHGLKYSCCPKTGTPPPPPASPFDGPIVSGPARYAQYKCCTSTKDCTVVQVGGPSVCKDAAFWAADAAAACKKKGGKVYGLGLYEACSL